MCAKSFGNRFPISKLNRKNESKKNVIGKIEKGRKKGNKKRDIGGKRP